MARTVLTKQGAFDADVENAINTMFAELYAAGPAVGAIIGPASAVSGNLVSFADTTGKLAADSGKVAADVVTGPASVTANKVALFNGTTGKIVKADAAGVSAGPFTTITAITVVNGLVTALTGS